MSLEIQTVAAIRVKAMLLPFLCLALLILTLAGCTDHVAMFNKAKEQQDSGKCLPALHEYARLLESVPADEPEVASLIQQHMGECLWALNRPREAYMALEESLRNNRNNREAHIRLAELLLAGGDSAEAVEHANLVLRDQPGDVEALSVIATALINSGHDAQAQAILSHILEIDAGQVNSATTLAEIYIRENRPEMARKVLRMAAMARPHDPKPWLALARLEEITGHGQAAEQFYRRAVSIEDAAETETRLAEFLARQSQIKSAEDILRGLGRRDRSAAMALPDFDLAAGRSAPAVALYARMLGEQVPIAGHELRGPATQSSVAARLIEAELQLACQQKRADDSAYKATLARANADLIRLRSKVDPGTASALEAEIALAGDDLTSAEQHADVAIRQAPDSPAAHYVLGVVRKRAGLANAAQQEWRTALQLAPDFTPARLALAADSLEGGDPAKVAELTSAVVREQPAQFQALCIYARALLALGRPDEAALIARRALAADASSAAPHEILGMIAVRQRNLGKALIEYEQALMLEPHSQSAVQGLTEVYRKGTIRRAMLSKIEKTATAPPKSATLMEIAGRLYADHGWLNDARRCLRLALLWDPQRKSAAAMLAQLYLSTGDRVAAEQQLTGGGASGLPRSETATMTEALEADYERELQRGDQSGAAANNLAWTYAQQGRNLDRALNLAQRAHSLAPQDPAVLDTLGVVYLKRREYTKAVQTLKKALDLAAKVPVAEETMLQFRQHLGEAYLRSGQAPSAAALER